MLCVPAYTHEHRPYSDTLHPTSFTLDSLLALTIHAQRKTYGWGFTSGSMACGAFSCGYMLWGERGGGLTGQPLGLLMGTATMRAVISETRVDLGRSSSR